MWFEPTDRDTTTRSVTMFPSMTMAAYAAKMSARRLATRIRRGPTVIGGGTWSLVDPRQERPATTRNETTATTTASASSSSSSSIETAMKIEKAAWKEAVDRLPTGSRVPADARNAPPRPATPAENLSRLRAVVVGDFVDVTVTDAHRKISGWRSARVVYRRMSYSAVESIVVKFVGFPDMHRFRRRFLLLSGNVLPFGTATEGLWTGRGTGPVAHRPSLEQATAFPLFPTPAVTPPAAAAAAPAATTAIVVPAAAAAIVVPAAAAAAAATNVVVPAGPLVTAIEDWKRRGCPTSWRPDEYEGLAVGTLVDEHHVGSGWCVSSIIETHIHPVSGVREVKTNHTRRPEWLSKRSVQPCCAETLGRLTTCGPHINTWRVRLAEVVSLNEEEQTLDLVARQHVSRNYVDDHNGRHLPHIVFATDRTQWLRARREWRRLGSCRQAPVGWTAESLVGGEVIDAMDQSQRWYASRVEAILPPRIVGGPRQLHVHPFEWERHYDFFVDITSHRVRPFGTKTFGINTSYANNYERARTIPTIEDEETAEDRALLAGARLVPLPAVGMPPAAVAAAPLGVVPSAAAVADAAVAGVPSMLLSTFLGAVCVVVFGIDYVMS